MSENELLHKKKRDDTSLLRVVFQKKKKNNKSLKKICHTIISHSSNHKKVFIYIFSTTLVFLVLFFNFLKYKKKALHMHNITSYHYVECKIVIRELKRKFGSFQINMCVYIIFKLT